MLGMTTEIRINVRTTPEIKRDIEIAARLRGLTVSSLVNSLAVKAIREEKEREPKAFESISAAEPPNISQKPRIQPLIKDEGMLDDEHAVKTKMRKSK